MSHSITKTSSLFLVFALLSALTLSCIDACPTCGPTPKSPPPPAPKSATPCPPPPPHKSPSPPASQTCPRDALKLGVCADLLGLVQIVVGSSGSKCCALLNGLTDLDAAVCLCTAIKANVLGIKLDVPVSLSVLLNACQKNLPSGYTCK